MSTGVTLPKDESGRSKSAAFPTTRIARCSLWTYFLGTRATSAAVTFSDLATVALQEVRRVAVKGVAGLLAQDLFLRIELEDERVQDGVFRSADLLVGGRLGGDVLDFFEQRVDTGCRCLALGAQGQAEETGMVEGGTQPAADGVGEPLFGTDVRDETGGKAAA
jgi:hypothetical protein